MSPMIDNEHKDDDLIIIIEDGKQLEQNVPIKSIIVNKKNEQPTPKSILKNKTTKQSKSFDQPNPKHTILKRNSFDVSFTCFNQTNNSTINLIQSITTTTANISTATTTTQSTTKQTHSILKHSHSSNSEDLDDTDDDIRIVKPILKKNKSFEYFKSDQSITNIKPILKKKDDLIKR